MLVELIFKSNTNIPAHFDTFHLLDSIVGSGADWFWLDNTWGYPSDKCIWSLWKEGKWVDPICSSQCKGGKCYCCAHHIGSNQMNQNVEPKTFF